MKKRKMENKEIFENIPINDNEQPKSYDLEKIATSSKYKENRIDLKFLNPVNISIYCLIFQKANCRLCLDFCFIYRVCVGKVCDLVDVNFKVFIFINDIDLQIYFYLKRELYLLFCVCFSLLTFINRLLDVVLEKIIID